MIEKDELDRRFAHHPPTPEQVSKIGDVRDATRTLVNLYADLPPGPEQNHALDALEQALGWGLKAIIRPATPEATSTTTERPALTAAGHLAGSERRATYSFGFQTWSESP